MPVEVSHPTWGPALLSCDQALLKHWPTLSLPPSGWAAQSHSELETVAAKAEKALLCSVHTPTTGFGLYYSHPPGKHIQKTRMHQNQTDQIHHRTSPAPKRSKSHLTKRFKQRLVYYTASATGCMTFLYRSPGYSNCSPHSRAPRQPQ